MPHPLTFLRTSRKRSPLTQSDIAYLMELPDDSNISRYEKGQRTPPIELLLIYHHLFDTSIESFFELQSNRMLTSLTERIQYLIDNLKQDNRTSNAAMRIKFLQNVVTRLAK